VTQVTPPAGRLGKQGSDNATLELVHHGGWPPHKAQRVVGHLELRLDHPVGVGQEPLELAV